MSGSRLGRGRGGRLAVYGGCGVMAILLFLLYRAATSEMARLRELHVQCAHQQEALAAQLQVIFEYKVRLETSLAEEKISNTAIKQELQQRASREKLLRDKDSVEAMQRFNSLQQTYKLLQTEHQDLQEECKKRETQVMEDTNKLEATLKELRSRIKQAKVDKEALEHLKNEFLELDTQKTQLEKKYNDLLKANGNTDSIIQHLRKELFQLKRELEETKKIARKATSPGPSIPNPLPAQPVETQMKPGESRQDAQPVGPSQQQLQVSPPTNDDKSPQPLHKPQAQQMIEDPMQSNEQRANEMNNVRFAQKNGNIVPVGPNEVKDGDTLPLPYDLQEKREKKEKEQPVANNTQVEKGKTIERDEFLDEEQQKQVIPPPNQSNMVLEVEKEKVNYDKKRGTDGPGNKESSTPLSLLKQSDEKVETTTNQKVFEKAGEKLKEAQNNVDDILNQIMKMI